MKNLTTVFWERCTKTPDKIFLKVKRQGEYIDITYGKSGRVVSDLYYGLKSMGLMPNDRVGIISENRPEWMYADMAILSAGAITVPLYESLSPVQVEYILQDSGCRFVFVSNEIQLMKVLKVCDGLPALECIIVMDDFNTSLKGKGVFTFFDIMRIGNEEEKGNRFRLPYENTDISSGNVATIIYTSGTTGVPKGAALSHNNIISNIESALQTMHVDDCDTCLSFLPLSHVLERTDGYYLMIRAGVTIAMAENLESIAKNLEEIKPTIMISVPRLYEKMFARVLEKVDSGPFIRKLIFAICLKIGRQASAQLQNKKRISVWLKAPYGLANRLVFNKMKQKLGGRIRFFIAGGAALNPEIARFFHAAGIIILEGYGLTETSPVVAVNRLNSFRFGSIGKPLPNVEVRFAEDTELLVRGPSVMLGYVNDAELTRTCIDEDGWFHTGDLGYMDDEGFLYITGRKKEVLVLSTGKNVSPAPLEKELLENRHISQTVVIGDGKKFVSCLIVPDFTLLERYATSENIDYGNYDELVNHSKVQLLYTKIIEDASKDFAKFEKIKHFKLLTREFDQANGEMTPTLKLKRDRILENFSAEIDEIYKRVEQTVK